MSALPGFTVIVELGLIDGNLPELFLVNILTGKFLRVAAQIIGDEICREVADIVSADSATDEANLFEVASRRDLLATEVCENPVQVGMQRPCEIYTQPAAAIAAQGKAEPVLPNLWKAIPEPQQVVSDRPICCFVPQENEVTE